MSKNQSKKNEEAKPQNQAKKNSRRRRRRPKKEGESGPIDPIDCEECPVCMNDMIYPATGSCGHAICSTCTLRMRFILNSRLCPLCKTDNERVIVSHAGAANVPSTEDIWGDSGGQGFDVDLHSGMFFFECRDHFQEMSRMKQLTCPLCASGNSRPFPTLESLHDHIVSTHNQDPLEEGAGRRSRKQKKSKKGSSVEGEEKCMCELCLMHRPLFIEEHFLFPSYEALVEHKQEEHIPCPLCSNLMFDKENLVRHLHSSAHFTCHLCASSDRIYNTREDLIDHFSQSHFTCPQCGIDGLFDEEPTVYGSTKHLNQHLAIEHNLPPVREEESMLNFRVASSQPSAREAPAFITLSSVLSTEQSGRRPRGLGRGEGEEEEEGGEDGGYTGPMVLPPLISQISEEYPTLPPRQVDVGVEGEGGGEDQAQEKNASSSSSSSQKNLPPSLVPSVMAQQAKRREEKERRLQEEAPSVKRIVWSEEMVSWANMSLDLLQKAERKIETFLNNKVQFALHLSSCDSLNRRFLHMLSTYYEPLVASSQSFQNPGQGKHVVFSKDRSLTSSEHEHTYHRNLILSFPSPLLSEEVLRRRENGPPIVPLPSPDGEEEKVSARTDQEPRTFSILLKEECTWTDDELREGWERIKAKRRLPLGEGMGIKHNSTSAKRMLQFGNKNSAEMFIRSFHTKIPLQPQFKTDAHKYHYTIKKGTSRQEKQRMEDQERSRNIWDELGDDSDSDEEEGDSDQEGSSENGENSDDDDWNQS